MAAARTDAVQVDAPELIGRLAALVCEGEEASVEDVRAGLAASIDQTLLDPCVGPERVAVWARENAFQGFATLCVQPCNVGRVAWELAQLGSPTGACGVLSFPQGQESPDVLCFQVAFALAAGAAELDLVMNYGAFLEGSFEDVAAPIQAALQTIDADPDGNEDECDCGCDCECECEHDCDYECDCDCERDHDHGHAGDHADDHDHDHDHADAPLLKVVLETGRLTPEQVCRATDLVSSLGVDFVEACTGCGPRGATVEDVRLMCATAEPGVQVKATGDIRTLDDALAMLEAGATRLGTSHGAEILAQFDALAVGLGGLDERDGGCSDCGGGLS